MGKIKIGLIGLGWVGLNRHVPAIMRSGLFDLVGIADRNEMLARDWARKLKVPHWCAADSMAGISWLDQVQAIDVATAPSGHFALVRGALLAGKHVITEKPFTLSTPEGRELLDVAKAADKRLAIVHNFQFASSARKAAAAIESGRIGEIKSIVASQWGNPSRRLPSWYDTLPGGLFFDESPHLLYLVRRFAPGPLELIAVDSCPSTTGKATPASVDISYRSLGANGRIPVTVSCRFEAPLSEWYVAILGTKAAAIVDVFRDIYIELPNDGDHATRDVVRTSLLATWKHWVAHLVNGPLHLSGRLLYGNDEVFSRFAGAIQSGIDPQAIAGQDAFDVLSMQLDVISRLRG